MKKTDIAIIGISGRFPKAKDHNQFWENIKNGENGISFFSDEELKTEGIDITQLDNTNYVKAKGVVEDVELFDASFFGFTPREAAVLSPQHRLALECSAEVLEHGGYGNDDHEDLIGVYMGAGMNTYLLNNIIPRKEEVVSQIGEYKTMIYNMNDSISTLISYKLNLKGPAVNINTACSTSLVSVHYACQGLQTYECDKALAGGVFISIPQKSGYIHEQGSILSPDGHCRAFDSESQGMVPGAGIGVVLLKRLADAIEDKDTIYAVIEGTAINNDGSEKAGFTAPSIEGQSGVIIDAQLMADIHPDTIDYIEAHGTGTAIGDPIEISALTKVFRLETQRTSYCAIGSVKTNIGHLDAAAGVAGLIKTTLALKERKIPPSLHYRKANPLIDFKNSPFYVNTMLKEWSSNGSPRRAGVSSFGIGGTNAHLILREAPQSSQHSSNRAYQIITLSAKKESALSKMIQNLINDLERKNSCDIADIAYTLCLGRKTYPHKIFVSCSSKEELIEGLKGKMDKLAVREAREKPTVMFSCSSGYNRNKNNLVQFLYDSELVFKQQIDLGAEHIQKLLKIDIRADSFNLRKRTSNISDSEYELLDRLLLFAAELSIAKLWMSWGVCPKILNADGFGLYTAGCLADIFAMEEALDLLISAYSFIENENVDRRVGSIRLKPSKTQLFSEEFGGDISNERLQNIDFWTNEIPTSKKEEHTINKGFSSKNNVLSLELGFGNTNRIGSWNPFDSDVTDLRSLYHALGELWLENINIDWKGFYEHENRNRVPLATYPFEKTRHWIEAKPTMDKGLKSVVDVNANVKNTNVSEWFYESFWIKTPFVESTKKEINKTSSCLFFTNEININTGLLKSISAKSDRVIAVRIGSKYEKNSDFDYRINPFKFSNYRKLLKELAALNLIPHQIIHGWNVTETREEINKKFISNALHLGFYSLNFLAIGLQDFLKETFVMIHVLSTGIHLINQEEKISPSKSTLLGALKVIQQEFPNIKCKNIDVTIPQAGTPEEDSLIRQLMNEVYGNINDNSVGYRNGKRWIQEFRKKSIDQERERKLKKGGIYLITGGLGGVGLNIAEYLAEQTQGTIILVNRSNFPNKENWDSSNIKELDKRKIKRLRRIEESKATVLLYEADVSDEEQMKEVIAKITKERGVLNGVVHAAAITGEDSFVPVRDINKEKCEEQFQAKIYGTNVLANNLKNEKLDFCVLFSSLSSVLGGLGLSTYAASNIYMDTLVHYHNKKNNGNWISINWDGLLHKEPSNKGQSESKIGASTLEVSLSPKETAMAFERIVTLTNPPSQIIVTASNLQARIDKWIKFKPTVSKSKLAQKETDLLDRKGFDSIDTTERNLIAIWEQSIGINNIGREDDFFELGGDSLLAITVLLKMNEAFSTDLSPSVFMNSSTVSELAKVINSNKEDSPVSLVKDRLKDSSIIEIQSGNPVNKPMILVHPVGGQVFFYKDLAKELPIGQPIYAYRAEGLEKGETPIENIEVMATKYVDDLIDFQEEGPYMLGGSSLGGMIAYEMAQQLKALGKKVKLLALIDTPMAQDMPQKMDDDARILYYLVGSLIKEVPFTVEILEELAPDQRLTFIVETIKKTLLDKNLIAQNSLMDEMQLERIVAVFKSNSEAFYKYTPQPYDGRISFFKAKERRKDYDPDHPELPWIELGKEGIEIHLVPGDHITMNLQPNVASIAKKINDSIQA